MSGGAPDEAHCLFCLDGGDAADPLTRGCACRGSSGWSHVTCLVKFAETARTPPGEPPFAAWLGVQASAHGPGPAAARDCAVGEASARGGDEPGASRGCQPSHHAEAVQLQRDSLDVLTRLRGPEHSNTLTCASNLVILCLQLGESAEAAALLRTTLTAHTRTLGPDGKDTRMAEGFLAGALLRLGKCAEAEATRPRVAREDATRPRSRPPLDARHVRQLGGLTLEARQARQCHGDPARGPRPACSAQSTRPR